MAEQRRLIISPNRLLDFAKPLPLNPGELHYLQRILRLKSGAGFNICDGHGTIYLANLCPDGNAQLIKKEALKPQIKPCLQLFFGLFRRDLEVMLRMATELGVDQLHPLQADYSLLEPGGQRQERWNSIIKEATEQSERAWLPQLAGLENTATALTTPAAVEVCRWIGVTREAGVPPLEKLLKRENSINAKHWQLACGPEGGWSSTERELAAAAGWQAVSLSPTVLRCSTAAISGLALMQHQRLQLSGESLQPSP